LKGWIMEDDKDVEVTAKGDIPIGHKLALKDYKVGDTVIKYGVDIGKVVKPDKNTFWGYKRENGRIGVRNHVVILPVDDLSNAAAQAVENNVKGTLALPHPYGRLQFGADLDLHFRTLIGTGSNPNVAAVVVICIEEEWAKKVADGIRASGKPVAHFGIEQHGDHDTIMRASKAAPEFLQAPSERRREGRPR